MEHGRLLEVPTAGLADGDIAVLLLQVHQGHRRRVGLLRQAAGEIDTQHSQVSAIRAPGVDPEVIGQQMVLGALRNGIRLPYLWERRQFLPASRKEKQEGCEK